MRNTHILAAAAAFMAVSGCASTPYDNVAVGDMTPEDARTYAEMAAASDMFELESSRLALTRAQDPALRQFAQMMIDDHSRTSQQLMAAARTADISLTPSLMPMQRQMLDELQQANGQTFDRLYRTQQIQAHEMAVALHGNYARSGNNPALRGVAAAATPIVTQHLARIRTIMS